MGTIILGAPSSFALVEATVDPVNTDVIVTEDKTKVDTLKWKAIVTEATANRNTYSEITVQVGENGDTLKFIEINIRLPDGIIDYLINVVINSNDRELTVKNNESNAIDVEVLNIFSI